MKQCTLNHPSKVPVFAGFEENGLPKALLSPNNKTKKKKTLFTTRAKSTSHTWN